MFPNVRGYFEQFSLHQFFVARQRVGKLFEIFYGQVVDILEGAKFDLEGNAVNVTIDPLLLKDLVCTPS